MFKSKKESKVYTATEVHADLMAMAMLFLADIKKRRRALQRAGHAETRSRHSEKTWLQEL